MICHLNLDFTMQRILGNHQIQSYFDNLVKLGLLSHAYLFYGPEGIGKRLFALKISEMIAGPRATNPDLKLIDKGNEEIHIADVRELKNFIHLTPFGKCKVVIINNAHNLGRDASNALLKILEEPPGKSFLFLISHLPKLLLATVLSRCQQIRFRPLKENEISDYLVNDPEGVRRGGPYGAGKKVLKEDALLILKLAKGSLGLAIKLADDFDDFQKNTNLLNKLVRADFKERFETAKKISGDSEDLKKIVGDWLIYSASPPHSFISSGGSLPDKRIAKELLRLNNILSRPQFNHRLALEGFLVRL